MNCAVCDGPLPAPAPAGRPRRYCCAACRRRAYHQRHRTVPAPGPAPEPRTPADAAPAGEPLMAAIVLIPLTGTDGAYAARPFAQVPWRELLAGLRDPHARPGTAPA